MIKVVIPNDNIPEREYIIKIIFSEFLGLQYSIFPSDTELNYTISFGKSEIIIKDRFFGFHRETLSYLNPSTLPESVIFAKNIFTIEDDIPVIYGTDEVQLNENNIVCGIDLFASSFFMLTRWEEYVNKNRDNYNRFPGKESIAFKNNFLNRPIVNEYVEMLWNMLNKLGFSGERRARTFELVPTHDVDALTLVSIKSVIGDFIKRRNIKLALRHAKYLYSNDPYDTYDYLMTTSEKYGVKSRFYFMSTDSKLEYDTSDYLKRIKFKSIIRQINARGHLVGFHPGYYTYDNHGRWSYEKKLLEEAAKLKIVESRQHYLRTDISKTLAICDMNNIEIDSTLGYADKEGFRCGTGDLFNVFDFLKRKHLQIKERPLIIMDGTLRQYQKYSEVQAKEIIQYYITVCERYQSKLTILFHNSSFYAEWNGYKSIYDEIFASNT